MADDGFEIVCMSIFIALVFPEHEVEKAMVFIRNSRRS
jgi:hypothetical protein